MGSFKVDDRGRVRCYPRGRKGFWKRKVAKKARRLVRQFIREQRGAA